MQRLSFTRYQVFILVYQFLFMGFCINSTIFRMQFILVFLLLIAFIEIKLVFSNIKYLVYFLSLSIISIIFFLIKDFYANASLPIYFFPLFIIIQIYKEKYIGPRTHLILLFIFLLFILVQKVRGIDNDYILDNRSRNMVSFYYLLYTIYYYIEFYRYKNKIPLWPALLSMFVSLLMTGRSGILSSSLLLLMVIGFTLKKTNIIGLLKYIISIIIIIFVITFLFKNQFMSFLTDSLIRFGERGVDLTGREYINIVYLQEMFKNWQNFVFGFPLTDSIFFNFDYNLHNSFLSLHYFFGIFAFVILYIILDALFLTRGKYFYKGILLILLIRGTFDQVFFIDFMDVIIFYLIFLIKDDNTKWIINK